MVRPSLASGSFTEPLKDGPRGILFSRARNEGTRQPGRRIGRERDGFLKTAETEVRKARPNEIARRAGFQAPQIKLRFPCAKPPSISAAVCGLPEHLNDRPGQKVEHGLPMVRYEGIDVHKMVQAIRNLFGDTGDDHSRIAVADQDHVIEVFPLQHFNNIVDMCPQGNRRRQGEFVVFQTRQLGNHDGMASFQ
jgi:hypothetical protein